MASTKGCLIGVDQWLASIAVVTTLFPPISKDNGYLTCEDLWLYCVATKVAFFLDQVCTKPNKHTN